MKNWIRGTLALSLILTTLTAQAEVKTINDVLGRDVQVDVPAKRVVLGFYYPDYIAATGAENFEQVVGISREFWEKFNPGSWNLYNQNYLIYRALAILAISIGARFHLKKP